MRVVIYGAYAWLRGGQDFRLSDGRSLRPGLSEDANPRGGVGRAAVSPDASVGQLSGNAIADHLGKQPGITVRSMKLDDAEQRLSAEVPDFAEVRADLVVTPDRPLPTAPLCRLSLVISR
jgi:hypothetical protein